MCGMEGSGRGCNCAGNIQSALYLTALWRLVALVFRAEAKHEVPMGKRMVSSGEWGCLRTSTAV